MKRILHLSILYLLSTSITAQCLDDQAHNTSVNSVWMSCNTSPNPFAEIGESHWIMYEFEQVESIESINIWNLNNPDQLTSGAQRIRMDISPDGASWTNMGVVELAMAEASADYVGELLVDFEAFEGRYVLFTILANHGGPCSGFAEVRFNLGVGTVPTIDEELAAAVIVAPNPADKFVNIDIGDIISRTIRYQVLDMTGKVLMRDVAEMGRNSTQDVSISTADLSAGTYAISMETDEGIVTKKIIVVHPN